VWSRIKKATPKPKVSEGSQFHQPPQLHSWSAHHEPKNSARPFAVKIGILLVKRVLIVTRATKFFSLEVPIKKFDSIVSIRRAET
jgi:hypothetical protein